MGGQAERNYTLLIVDDSKTIVHYLIDILNNREHNLLYTYSKDEALKIIRQNDIDILVCDLMLPSKEDGLEIIRFFKQQQPNSKVLGISAYTKIENIVSIIKTGADDFIPKTATKDQIIKKIEELKNNLLKKNSFTPVERVYSGEDVLIGQSAAIRDILEKIEIIAKNEVETCLIVGESGTGKELVAKTIHKLSPRRNKPFVALNCAGMPDNLVDSELFGFERGSFTGAYQTTLGKFELANGGIFFLDEISELPLHLQGKFLRVLENREVVRIGGKKAIPIDVMILAATNQDLAQRVNESLFREDIYYRLNMIKIELPPLRERKEDIPLLVDYFLQKIQRRIGKVVQISDEALAALVDYHFPGNVRELKNIVYNAAIFSLSNRIEAREIKNYLKKNALITGNGEHNRREKGNKADEKKIVEVLRRNAGNISQSAKELGYTREGLSRKIKKMGLDLSQFRNVS